MFFSIEPISLILFIIGICEDSKAIFLIPLPLSIVDGSTFVDVDSSSTLFALLEFTLILLSIGICVEPLSMEAVILPITHENILIWELIHSPPMLAVNKLTNIFSSIFIVDFLKFGLDFSTFIEKLGKKFLLLICFRLKSRARYTNPEGVLTGDHHGLNCQLIKMLIT